MHPAFNSPDHALSEQAKKMYLTQQLQLQDIFNQAKSSLSP